MPQLRAELSRAFESAERYTRNAAKLRRQIGYAVAAALLFGIALALVIG